MGGPQTSEHQKTHNQFDIYNRCLPQLATVSALTLNEKIQDENLFWKLKKIIQ